MRVCRYLFKGAIKRRIEQLYCQRDAWVNEEPYYLKGSFAEVKLKLMIEILSFKIVLWESLL